MLRRHPEVEPLALSGGRRQVSLVGADRCQGEVFRDATVTTAMIERLVFRTDSRKRVGISRGNSQVRP
jgi:hypothetical protein